MPELIAIDVAAGPAYVDAIRKVWDDGHAFMPLDPRLPALERQRVIDALAPTAILDDRGTLTKLPAGRPVDEHDALVISTSGTTGLPKGVVHTHSSVRASALATSSALGIDPAHDHWLACLPLAHIGGLSVILRAMLTDTRLTVQPGFDPQAVTNAAQVEGVTRISLVTRALAQVDPALFTTVLLGGAAPPAHRPANCIATYGMTETGSGIVYEGTILDGVELRADADGQLWTRGPMLLRAYRHAAIDEDPRDVDGWFPTGDSGGFDANGRLFVSGRMAEVIMTGGEKVWPGRVEVLLEQLPGVAEVAVIGRPHPQWGQAVTAVVVPSDRANPPTLEMLRAHIKESLPVWYAPQVLELRAALPRTQSGKILRNSMLDQAR